MLFAKTQELKLKFVFVLAFFLNLILITGKSLIWQCRMPVKRTLKFQVACSLHKDPKMGFHSLSFLALRVIYCLMFTKIFLPQDSIFFFFALVIIIVLECNPLVRYLNSVVK